MKKILLSLLAFSALQANAQIPTSGLVEHFTFDNTFTGVNGNVVNGTSNFQDDRNENNTSAYLLDDIGYVCLGFDINNFPTAINSAKSIAFWFKHNADATHSFFNYNSDGNVGTNSFYVSYDNGNLLFGSVTDDNFAFLSTAMPYSVSWTHVVMSFNGTEVKVYINGVLAATEALSVPSLANNGDANIGASPGSEEYYHFTIDELLIYDRALSLSEVSTIYGTGNSASLIALTSTDFDVYPNPTTNGLVTISNAELGATIQIADASGRVIATQTSEMNAVSFDITNQENGVYFVSIKGTDGTSTTKKLIVRK